uniref:Uncharacterized protein n=1 Tax=Rhizophora mucronata TaxID=61149 RepID=A0A2P2QJY9_RHIMU
MSNCKYNFL